MLISIIGLPNKGKSTLFNALTSGNAAVANYPFTTIDPNKGIAFASADCPHVRLQKQCNPNNSRCENGVRKIPINILDVAGLVEGAHAGRGRGNQFLADVAASDCAILVADASGGTDDEGNPCAPGSHDVTRDVSLIEGELDFWYHDVLERNALKAKGKKPEELAQLLSGMKMGLEDLKAVAHSLDLDEAEIWNWEDGQVREAAQMLRVRTKPLVIAANKIDSEHAEENIKKLGEAFPAYSVIPVSADAELALRRASERRMIRYGGNDFALLDPGIPGPLKDALERIRHAVLSRHGSTGVQQLVNHCTFVLQQQIAVYPVEDEVHFSNHFGKVLPDAILMRKGSKAADLAAKIHSDLAAHMLYAVDAERKMRIGKDAELHDGQIVKIVSAK